ncbi:MAG: hypothetical protein ACRD30_10435 [Bryobacteraceae bacterium]
MGRVLQRFLAHVLPGVIRPIHALWNQTIGFVFLVLAASAVPPAVRNMRHFQGDPESFFRVLLPVGFGLLMAYFGITSLLRARKISRS